MKKLVLLILVIAVFQAQAQHRFYAGLNGGPSVSFSNTTLYNGSVAALEIANSAQGKLKYQVGALAGYNFRNPRFSIETGFSRHDHAMVAQFNKWEQYPLPPEIRFSYATEQIHLTFKTTLNNPESKIRILVNMGGAWVFSSSGVQFEDKSLYEKRRKFEPYLFPYATDRPENFSFEASQQFYGFGWSYKEKWLLLSGFEAETNLTSRLNLSLSLNYQTSIRPVQAFGFEYNYNFQRSNNQYGGAYYEPMQYGTLLSKAEALNLNLGLTYNFSKRKNKAGNSES